MKNVLLLSRALLCCTAMSSLPVISNASVFDITIDTTALQGTTGALAFDFLDGDGLINNTISISNFTSDATLAGNTPAGDITGTLSPGPVILGDTTFFNEWLQDIAFGTSLNFRLESTGNGPLVPAPDSFSFFLLDSMLLPYPTDDPLGTDALFILDIDRANPVVQLFSSASAAVTVSAVPLPGALLLFISGSFGILGIAKRARLVHFDTHRAIDTDS